MDLSSIHALTFDVFGTVTDWRRTIIREGEELAQGKGLEVDWPAFALEWRAGYQPAMQRVRTGELPWMSIDELHRLILEDLLVQFEIFGLSEAKKDNLNRVWHRLDPWPDARGGLERLRRRFTVATLSNGNMALLTNLAKHADLRWDCILSAELARHYKPDAEVYRTAVSLLALRPQEVMMVAAHNADLQGAKAAGLRTAFVSRPNEYGLGQTTDLEPEGPWDVVASDFHDLAERLADR